MAYLDTLGENIVYEAKTTKWIFAIPLFLAIWGFYSFYIDTQTLVNLGKEGLSSGELLTAVDAPKSFSTATFLMAIAVILGIRAFIIYWTTELAITEKRVVAKYGLIRRTTIELRLDKVESVMVKQGFLGRILNYGDVVVVGTGASGTPIPYIAEPLEFRTQLYKILEHRENSKKS